MVWLTRVGLWLAACATTAPAPAAGPPARPKAKVEFRWMEVRPVKGLTLDKGTVVSCGPVLWYLHSKPILTNGDVAEARLRKVGPPSWQGEHYDVSFQLTKQARAKLVAACAGKGGLLAVVVDGKYWTVNNFQKATAAGFVPSAGYFSSKAEAERVVEACQRWPAP